MDTHALDGVTLSFPERGMVFLLGKSGSGKSTLLNVCGGLDSPTDGEIIVKGRSSKDFSQSDFDSYRNTFVGFIFQEYNILSEFTVEDNIALALELQGKPKDKKAIAELLEQVDLTGFAKRKPNTLSGGQKQRIAIARALVKSPEIIMADEPTGALDSTTGKQVFDTLKKLSQDKLVIVVSHDREFAELYADRIIELKDGKILSDVSKTQQKQQAVSENVSTLGNVLCIKRGSTLGERDLAHINQLLRSAEGDVIIASGERDVENFKKASRITDDGAKEIFVETDEDTMELPTYKPEDSRFIRSKLPAKHAAKIGISSLKTKPVRLVFTILLCVISFVLFGLLSTLSFYDSEATFKETMKQTGGAFVSLEKDYEVNVVWYTNGQKESEYTTDYDALFSDADIETLKAQFGPSLFGGVKTDMSYNVRSKPSSYWLNSISTIAYLPEGHPMRATINGSYPAAEDEICISSYMAELMYNCKLTDKNGTEITLHSANDVIGKSLTVDGTAYKIVGIVDSGAVDAKYDALKDGVSSDYSLLYEFEMALGDGLHLVSFVSENRLAYIAKYSSASYGGDNDYYRSASAAILMAGKSDEYSFSEYPNTIYKAVSSAQSVRYIVGHAAELGENEAVVVDTYLASHLRDSLYALIEGAEQSGDTEAAERYRQLQTDCEALQINGTWVDNGNGEYSLEPLTKQERDRIVTDMLALLSEHSAMLGLRLMDRSNTVLAEATEYKIVGLTSGDDRGETIIHLADAVTQSLWDVQKQSLSSYEEMSTNYKNDPNAIFSVLFLPYDRSNGQTDSLWSLYSNREYAENDSKFTLVGRYISELQTVDSMVEMLSDVFLYVGLVLALFSVLLFANFISVSISQKKREIGILRAVGARGVDVFKIFFSESFTIALISILLSTAGTVVLCNLLNAEFGAMIGASIFVFGVASFAIMVGIAVVTAVVATLLPVWNAARKKPVESIRAL